MELKVGETRFGGQGGSGGGQHGRGRADGSDDEPAPDEDKPPETVAGKPDALGLSAAAGLRSRLRLGTLRTQEPGEDTAAVVAALNADVATTMALLAHRMTKLEGDYARRLRAEVGETRIE